MVLSTLIMQLLLSILFINLCRGHNIYDLEWKQVLKMFKLFLKRPLRYQVHMIFVCMLYALLMTRLNISLAAKQYDLGIFDFLAREGSFSRTGVYVVVACLIMLVILKTNKR